MAATQHHQSTDHIIAAPNDSAITESLVMNAEEKLVQPDIIKEQDAAISYSRDSPSHSGAFNVAGDLTVYPPNLCAPLAHTMYYKGFENASGKWDEYSPFINTETLDTAGSPTMYTDNSLVFHTGYGYNSQMPYGPYSPVTTPLPSVGGDAQLYSTQQYTFPGSPYYQHPGPPTLPYITSPTPVSQPELNSLVSSEHVDGVLYGPRPGYSSPLGSLGRGNLSVNPPGRLGFQDSQQNMDALRTRGLWSDWRGQSDRQRSFVPLSPSVSPQAISTFGSFQQNFGSTSQQPPSFYGFGSGASSYDSGYINSGLSPGHGFGNSSISNIGTDGRGWASLDNGRRRGRGSGPLCNCSGTLDILSEQNRGPRASRPKGLLASENSPPAGSNKSTLSYLKTIDASYNLPDCVSEYSEAKFFIIKSYSEDNVHKSIKYSIWASTSNGNRKLDAAYREAKEKQSAVRTFLFFSVNASGQFCGVAEMIGPVDFDKSVDYWQQDKWSGQFPVKWHIIKDVPNSQFRHIVLENNDNKPVTNSRDTQQVKFEQGIEMLNIFKKYETDMSILDDFEFYEERQKAMQERKARQLGNLGVGAGGNGNGNESKNVVAALSNDFIRQMSKSFSEVVRLDESDRGGATLDASMSKLEKAITAAETN
ncbi:hypothetical protein L6452_07944 [Arctium lappa]|uniref:Uncharacterized protein n=1 Tax=Arctium lappa TaxID=4217 RepID=A0ACB9EMQ5_ARCLA|nr:hypothetical protein L6452_07944 [Arctium lappa]